MVELCPVERLPKSYQCVVYIEPTVSLPRRACNTCSTFVAGFQFSAATIGKLLWCYSLVFLDFYSIRNKVVLVELTKNDSSLGNDYITLSRFGLFRQCWDGKLMFSMSLLAV